MRVMRFVLASLGVVGLISAAALTQEGHPIKGSWLGDFGPNKTTRTQVFLVMDWDGKAISGMINPGTDNIPIKNATLNPEGWLVHLEAETKDKAGPITYVIDGKIEGLAFHNRSVTGTWKGRGESGPFKISRQ
jgi:hypothetical protein